MWYNFMVTSLSYWGSQPTQLYAVFKATYMCMTSLSWKTTIFKNYDNAVTC